jgi:hypothetical protein
VVQFGRTENVAHDLKKHNCPLIETRLLRTSQGQQDHPAENTVASQFTPKKIAWRISAGLLSFPMTPLTPAFAFDERRYRENLERHSS